MIFIKHNNHNREETLGKFDLSGEFYDGEIRYFWGPLSSTTSHKYLYPRYLSQTILNCKYIIYFQSKMSSLSRFLFDFLIWLMNFVWQAGAGLGQAQLKLELGFNSFEICCIEFINYTTLSLFEYHQKYPVAFHNTPKIKNSICCGWKNSFTFSGFFQF